MGCAHPLASSEALDAKEIRVLTPKSCLERKSTNSRTLCAAENAEFAEFLKVSFCPVRLGF